jgi:hypothetical protein
MSSVDGLPPDQRAVLQMVLQRGYSYDDIAALLSIDRTSVRRRALEALDSLAPTNSIPAEKRALLTDYLLGQLPEGVAEQVHGQLGTSPPDRAWARVIAAQIGELSNVPLPEIPVGSHLPPEPAADEGAWAALADEHLASTAALQPSHEPEPEPPAPVWPEPDSERAPAWSEPEPPASAAEHEQTQSWTEPEPGPAWTGPEPAGYPAPAEPDPEAGLLLPEPQPASPSVADEPPSPAVTGSSRDRWEPPSPISAPGGESPRSSRLGGAIVLGLILAVVVVVVVLLLNSGGSSTNSKTSAGGQTTPTQSTPTQSTPTQSTPTQSTPTGTTNSTTTPATGTPVYQVNLKPPNAKGRSLTNGVAAIVRTGRTLSIVIVGQDMPAANTVSSAYAVWLYTSPSSEHLLGFLVQSVAAHGTLKAEATLPRNASIYKQLLITLETKARPKVPGKIVLEGAFGT